MENLKLAHKNARKDKAFYKDVKKVDSDPEFYLGQIQEMLMNKTYTVSDYSVSTINDKGKDRELMKLPYFPDRIIQWAILLQIEKVFVNTLCGHTCASLKGRGIKRAMKLVDEFMTDVPGTEFCLKIDIRKFYPNINHAVLKQLLRKKFKDADLLELLDRIIDSYPGEKGVPIGSYLSQYLANYYLAYFDHWLKEEMQIKYVVRYMDDIVIFSQKHSCIAFESRWTNIFEFGLTFKSNRIGRCFLSMQGALTLWDIGFSTVTNYYAKPPAKSSRRKWCKSKGNSVTAI